MCSSKLVAAISDPSGTVSGAISGTTKALGLGAPDVPDIPAPTPPKDTSAADAKSTADAARTAKQRRLQARGRSSTILTGSQGVLTTPTTQQNTLLGQ